MRYLIAALLLSTPAQAQVVRVVVNAERGERMATSGFAVHDGSLVVTCSHQYTAAGRFTTHILTSDGKIPARTLVQTQYDDLTVLQVKQRLARPLVISGRKPATGDKIKIAGYVKGYPRVFTAEVEKTFKDSWLFYDRPGPRGISGGPVLFDDRVVGISLTADEGRRSLAVSLGRLQRIVAAAKQALAKHGHRPWTEALIR